MRAFRLSSICKSAVLRYKFLGFVIWERSFSVLPRWWKPVVLACSLAFLNVVGQAQQVERLPLDNAWQFRQHVNAVEAGPKTVPAIEWRPAEVPGDVHLDLLRNHLIDDPFYRDNEAKLQWIEKASWEYRTIIQGGAAILAHQHVDLVFEGLDAACDIYLNGTKLASPDSMFREWRVDLKGKIKEGANELLIVFPSPIEAAEKVAAKDPWQSRIHTDPKTYIRKAAYEYGWDWGPRFVTSGIWRPVHLEVWNDARVSDLFVEQKDVSASVAHLNVQTDVVASHEGTATLHLAYGLESATVKVDQTVTLAPGLNHFEFPVEILHPSLWYPAGYGAQPIYSFHEELDVDGKSADRTNAKTGLRSIVLLRKPDQWGRSFEFVVNGIPVFAKGADVIPFDSFPSRVTTEQYRHILQSAKDANMNMIRHWGGGYYESQDFYDMCDEMGLMVWQDLMFGNDWQPGTYDFKQQIEREAEYQITRLRNHPSIVLWSGNNETELVRDWNGRGDLPVDARLRLWEDYLTEFSGILASTAARLEPEIPYWPSSPSSDYEDLSDSFQSGDNHDWTVWHGNADFSAYEEHHWRFVSEYGFQSFPEMKTIEAFTTPADRTSIFTPVMLAHQKNSSGNSIIHDYMLRYYGEPKDFSSFLYASQILQAEGVKTGAEGFRRAMPRTMGSIFWQLNDCWPVASWSSIDYYGRWKALQYYARRFYAPILVSPHIENGVLAVYVVSDKTKPEAGQVHLRIMDFSGRLIREISEPVTIAPLASKIYLQVPLSELSQKEAIDPATTFGAADLMVQGADVSSNLVFFAPSKEVQLPHTEIGAEIKTAGSGFDVTLRSPVLARSAYLSFGEADADFSDNYIDLLPNEPVTIHVTSKSSLEELRSQMKVTSLVDAFSGVLPKSN
jgi:beta-mannosidase